MYPLFGKKLTPVHPYFSITALASNGQHNLFSNTSDDIAELIHVTILLSITTASMTVMMSFYFQ